MGKLGQLPLLSATRVKHEPKKEDGKVICSCGKELATFEEGMQHLKEERVVGNG